MEPTASDLGRTNLTARYVVFNPGSHPAPRWIATALSEVGLLDTYWTALQFADQVRGSRIFRLIPGRIRRALANRMLPPRLEESRVRRAALLTDAVAGILLSLRAGAVRNRLVESRNRRLARKVGKHLGRFGASGDYVVISPTDTRSGIEDICLAAGVRYFLYTPLPDAAYCAGIFRDEAVRSPDWARFLGELPPEAASLEEERHVNTSDGIIANSGFTARSFSTIRADLPIGSIPLAVDLDRLRGLGLLGKSCANRRLPGQRLRVAYAGQINQRKGLSYLFEAANRLVDVSDIEIALYGSDHLGMVSSLRASYPRVRVDHQTTLPQVELWHELSAFHVFAFPTILDGFGNSLAEAAALGLPSIATDRCGVVDLGLVPDGGILVPAQDPTAIAAALSHYFTDEDARQQASRSAADTMAAGRSWDQYGTEAVAFIESVSR